MCQFAKLYSIEIIKQLIKADQELENPYSERVLSVMNTLNEFVIRQELPIKIEDVDKSLSIIIKHPISKIENYFRSSPSSKINWASHMVLMDSKLPLGSRYWYMKQSVELGWSTTILKIQIDSNLLQRQ